MNIFYTHRLISIRSSIHRFGGQSIMKKIFQIGSAFIGVIIGAGFASGQEILQYYVSFGYFGLAAALLAAVLFSFMGVTLMKLGSNYQATSHSDVIYHISGRILGKIIDYILIIALFGFGVVMIAGGGSSLQQQFGLPHIVGSLFMLILVILSVIGNVDRVIKVIGSITPFLIVAVIFLCIYSFITKNLPLNELSEMAVNQKSAVSNWFVSTLNYVSMNIVLGASMTIVMGGNEKNDKTAIYGGLVGGLGIGILIIVSYLTIFSKVDVVGHVDMPLLKIADEISPILGVIYSVILFGMIFNTAIGMFFSFGARFAQIGTAKFKWTILISGIVALALSFLGFTDLVSFFYPVIGYLGFVLFAVLIISWFRKPVASVADHERKVV